jgi:hypothetical protein
MPTDQLLTGIEAQLSDDVRVFCKRHAIMVDLEKAVELARDCFSIAGTPHVRFEQDPEDASSYVVLEIQVRGDEVDCADSHMRYMSTWANSVGWPEVHLIRLIYDII